MIPQSNKLPCSPGSWVKAAIYMFVFLLSINLSAQSAPCQADAGTLKKTSLCFLPDQTLLKAFHRGDAVVPEGYQKVYLLTHGDQQVIEQIANEAIFELPMSDSLQGVYGIHTLVYNPATLNLGDVALHQSPLSQVNDQLLQGGGTICAALDLDGAEVQFGECELPCKASAGTLLANPISCFTPGEEVTLSAKVQAAPIIPSGFTYLYLLVNQADEAILNLDHMPSFQLLSPGNYSIHTLVYDTTTLDLNALAELGPLTLTGIDTLLKQGGGAICGALDKHGAVFQLVNCPAPCQVNAGTLSVKSNPCLSDSAVVISATTKNNPTVPNGHLVRYLLSSGAAKIVRQISNTPSFTVSDTGVYTIHTMVFDTATFKVDSLAFGEIQVAALDSALDSLCGDVDLTGAVFNVKTCPPFICSAKAGALVLNDSTCLYNGKATLSATVAVAPLVPFGYDAVYLLTYGNAKVVDQISTTPTFDVTREGHYVIQAFVYDTAAFKLDSIRIGQMTATEIQALLVQGGGSICGALDTIGAVFNLEVCSSCPASAGTLTSNTDPCLENGKATLTVYNLDAPTVPSGFKLAYLLSNDSNVIEQVSDSAVFVVDRMGLFTVHTLVYDYALLDLSTIETGVTKVSQLNSQLTQGGGTMCGALDVKGFSFFVIPCPVVCDARAGTLRLASESCLLNGVATIEAAHDKAPVVPEGFEVRYLLSVTDLQVIRAISTTPAFNVSAVGAYKIHTLVYDPVQLNINDIKLNITRVADVDSWLYPSGGDICGAIDKKGVGFNVEKCGDDCGLSTGSLGIGNANICITNGNAILSAFIINQPFVLAGYKVKYLLSYGNNQTILQTSDDPVFRVNQTGKFSIHVFVYNPTTFNINAAVLGTSTIADVDQLLVQGGGTICGALDLTGVEFQVNLCNQLNDDASQLRAYPNPSTQKVNVVLPYSQDVKKVTVELINSNGDVTEQWQVDGYTPSLYLDISSVNPGIYYIRVLYDGQFVQQTSAIRAQ